MLSRKDFSSPDWYKMQACLVGTAKYVALTDKNFLDDFREMRDYNRLLNEIKDESPSPFIADLIDFDNYKSPIPKHTLDDASAIEVPVLMYIKDSVNLLKKVGPAELIEFRQLVNRVANETADHIDETSDQELLALQKITHTLYS